MGNVIDIACYGPDGITRINHLTQGIKDRPYVLKHLV